MGGRPIAKFSGDPDGTAEKESAPMATAWYHPDGRPATAEEAQALFLDSDARLLAQDTVHVAGNSVVVSTWFTVIDHGPSPEGQPLLWETVVCDTETYADVAHYSTREQAQQGHTDVVVWITYQLRRLAPETERPTLAAG